MALLTYTQIELLKVSKSPLKHYVSVFKQSNILFLTASKLKLCVDIFICLTMKSRSGSVIQEASRTFSLRRLLFVFLVLKFFFFFSIAIYNPFVRFQTPLVDYFRQPYCESVFSAGQIKWYDCFYYFMIPWMDMVVIDTNVL